MMRNIKDYEEAEKIRKDHEISKAQAQEIKNERDRRYTMNNEEKYQFKDNLNERLDKYKQALKEKAVSEKQVKIKFSFIQNVENENYRS